jgi:hypothetical protein
MIRRVLIEWLLLHRIIIEWILRIIPLLMIGISLIIMTVIILPFPATLNHLIVSLIVPETFFVSMRFDCPFVPLALVLVVPSFLLALAGLRLVLRVIRGQQLTGQRLATLRRVVVRSVFFVWVQKGMRFTHSHEN